MLALAVAPGSARVETQSVPEDDRHRRGGEHTLCGEPISCPEVYSSRHWLTSQPVTPGDSRSGFLPARE